MLGRYLLENYVAKYTIKNQRFYVVDFVAIPEQILKAFNIFKIKIYKRAQLQNLQHNLI